MAGDGKAANFLGADPIVGNVASASLLLVLGWILGQLKWDYMLMAGLGIAVILVLFLAWRYLYALRHPPSHPLTRQELHDVLEELTTKSMREQNLIERVYEPGRDLPQTDGPEPASGKPRPGPGSPEPRRRLKRRQTEPRTYYLVDPGPAPRRTAWRAAFRQMLGVR
jgi:hypothetical protein